MNKQLLSIFFFIIASSFSLFSQKPDSTSKASLTRRLPGREIVLHKLSLHKILVTIKTTINHMLQQYFKNEKSSPDVEGRLLSAVGIVDEALSLMQQIVDDFNKQCFFSNPEIEYRFVNTCNFLADVESNIEPRHIRGLSEKIKRFNEYVTLYCMNRKDFLEPHDLDLFNKITKFNQILVLCLLREDYFEIDFLDTVADYIIYRPWEFMCEHKVLTGIVVTALLAGGGYAFYSWYKQKQQIPSRKSVYFDDVVMVKGLKQESADCGYYALVQAHLAASGTNQQEIEQRLSQLKDKGIISSLKNKIINDRTNKKENPNKGNWLKTDELKELSKSQEFNDALQSLGIKQPLDNVVILEGISPEMLKSGTGITSELAHSINHLKDTPQCIIVCDAPQGDEKPNINGRGHWWAVNIVSDGDSKNGLKAFVVDSFFNDQRNNKSLEHLLQLYEKQDTPYPEMLPVHEELNRAHVSFDKKETDEAYNRFFSAITHAAQQGSLKDHPVTLKALKDFFDQAKTNVPEFQKHETFDDFLSFLETKEK